MFIVTKLHSIGDLKRKKNGDLVGDFIKKLVTRMDGASWYVWKLKKKKKKKGFTKICLQYPFHFIHNEVFDSYLFTDTESIKGPWKVEAAHLHIYVVTWLLDLTNGFSKHTGWNMSKLINCKTLDLNGYQLTTSCIKLI